MESVMKKLLFAAAALAALTAATPALACHECDFKWGDSAFENYVPKPVCHLVRQRIEMRHGHAIYRTLQVCN
jgi:hypothetical protein